MMITALYFVVDGIFVGQGIGPLALAAVNLSLPVIVLIISTTMMLTMGGATLASISLGQKDPASANRYFGATLQVVLAFSVLAAALCAVFPEQIARLSGASEMMVPDTAVYIRWYCIFVTFYCLAMCLSAFVRNDGDPQLSLWAMTTGALTNIFLDWLFIFPLQMGLFGAAVASGIGQALSCLLLLIHFFRKKGQLRLHLPLRDKAAWKLTPEIARRGLPEFCTEMSQTVTTLLYNILSQQYLQEMGVAAFAVMCYISEIFIAVFLGVSQGVQPLISYSFGAGDRRRQLFFFRWGLVCNVALSALAYLIILVAGPALISVFNGDPQLIALAYDCAKVFSVSFIFAAVNIVFTTYFLSTKRTGAALAVAAGRSFLLNSVCIFLLPLLFGAGALYTGIIAAELLVSLCCLIYAAARKDWR